MSDTTHTYIVTVSGCSQAEAEQVMAERLGHDEDYGFDYTVEWKSEADDGSAARP